MRGRPRRLLWTGGYLGLGGTSEGNGRGGTDDALELALDVGSHAVLEPGGGPGLGVMMV
jgi:hypothetical protein